MRGKLRKTLDPDIYGVQDTAIATYAADIAVKHEFGLMIEA